MDFEERLEMEEEVDGMDVDMGGMGDRGLEHTLEKLGFGASPPPPMSPSLSFPVAAIETSWWRDEDGADRKLQALTTGGYS